MSNTTKDSLGDRMKTYEGVTKTHLVRRMPAILRLDGKAFHSFCRGLDKPFDLRFQESMWETAKYLCEKISGARLAYVQSDEISILLTDYENVGTQAWFDGQVQKIVSVSASMAGVKFNHEIASRLPVGFISKKEPPVFDARVFNVPKEDVVNSFIWRQQDATRNSVSMLAQANFSHKQLHKKSCNEMQEMLFQEYGINWNDCPVPQKRGVCIKKNKYYGLNPNDGVTPFVRTRWEIDLNIPVFTQDRNYIEQYVNPTPEVYRDQ